MYGARPILHEFSRALMHTLISKVATFPQKKKLVKMRKLEADSDSDGEENHACSRLQTNSNAIVGCMLISLSYSKEIYFYFTFGFGL